MAINRVNYGNTVLIDLTQDTVTPQTLAQGSIAHNRAGNVIVGEMIGGIGGPHTAESTINGDGTQNIEIVDTGGLELQDKSITPTKSTQTLTADAPYIGLNKVTVNPIPDQYIIPSGSQTINANGNYTVTSLSSVTVNVPIPDGYIKPSGSQTITENGSYDVTSLAEILVNTNVLPDGIAAMDYGTYVKSNATTTAAFTVDHNLGVVPDFVLFYTPTNIATTYSMLAAVRGTIVNWRNNYNSHYAYHGNSTSTVTWANSNNANYGVGTLTATSFRVASHSTSYYWRAATYRYIAIKFA